MSRTRRPPRLSFLEKIPPPLPPPPFSLSFLPTLVRYEGQRQAQLGPAFLFFFFPFSFSQTHPTGRYLHPFPFSPPFLPPFSPSEPTPRIPDKDADDVFCLPPLSFLPPVLESMVQGARFRFAIPAVLSFPLSSPLFFPFRERNESEPY